MSRFLLPLLGLIALPSAYADLQPRTTPAETPAKDSSLPKPLTEESVDKLLEQLREIDSSLKGKRSSYNASLLPRLNEAGNNDDKAFSLWLEATKEVNYEAQGKSATEFSDFRNGRGKDLRTNSAFTGQLRLQCRFLAVVIMQADAETDSEMLAVVQAASAYLDDYVSNAKKLEGKQDELRRTVLDSVIAKHLKLDVSARRAKGPAAYNPGNIAEIYNDMILPYYREKKAIAGITSAWNKRISQETAMVEVNKVPEQVLKFQQERVPELKWNMARDLFNAGQEEPASAAMVGIIKANLAHRNTPGWIKELAELVQEKSAPETSEPVPSPPSAP